MKRPRILAAAVFVLVVALALPTTALAFQFTGGAGTQTQNAYGQWYAGQEACAIEGCHSAIAAKPSPHSTFVTDVRAHPELLQPSPDSPLWPYSPLGSMVLKPRDIFLQLGDARGFHEYVGGVASVVASGVTPADDLTLLDGATYYMQEDAWVPPGKAVSPKAYSQGCSECHNLGVTRPSDKTYTLASGAVMSTATPSSMSGMGIQCEVCHGTGKNPNGHKPGVPSVVAGTQILKAQVCGQCHMSGTTAEKNAAGKAFGNPNGYTTDATLSAFVTPYSTVESEATFMNYVKNGGSKPKFLPNGDNFSMNHGYYNEWLNTGHKNSPRSSAMNSSSGTKCMRCHSGTGFLYRIDARSPQGKRIIPTEPTTTTVAANDPGISCQVCHTGHVGYTPTGYDDKRRWGNGKEVSCGDCHNWRFEQLDLPMQYETINGIEYTRPPANNRPHPSQREMWAGGYGGDDGMSGLWGVAPVGQVMTNTRCEDCHMPRTYRESAPVPDDGSTESTRMSHRFMVVLPADAARWNLRKGGDSCAASCHTGDAADYTRADFQSWIDDTSATVTAMSLEASNALQAVGDDLGFPRYRNFESAQPTTGTAGAMSVATWNMLQHAAQNVEIVSGDKSNGIHNKAYAVAGLRMAIFWAQSAGATITASTDALGNGEGMTVAGTLLGTHGVVIGGAKVVLETSTDGGSTWTFVATATPDAHGAFTVPTGRIVGSRLYRCSFSPDSANKFSTAPMSVQVPVTLAALTPATAAAGWIAAPSVTVSLAVTPGASLTYYSLTGATTQAETIYTGPFAVTAEGQTTVTFRSANADGVEAAQTQLVRIDRGSPILACDAVASYADKAVVRLWANDPGGVTLQYALDGAPLATSPDAWAVLTVVAPGSHTLAARATDGAGHVSARSWAFSVKATPKFALAPAASSTSVARGRSLSLGVALTSAAGAPVGGSAIYLQRSSNGTRWSNYAKLSTSAAGKASRGVRFSSRGTSYWRWYVPGSSRVFAGASSRRRVVTR